MLDARNKLSHHIIIAVFSSLLVLAMGFTELGFNRAIAAVPFFLLFLAMILGPAARIWPSLKKIPPKEFPWALRGELGIWFVVWSIVHILLVFHRRDWAVIEYITGMSPWVFGAFVAVFLGIVLAVTSSRIAIQFLGFDAWKWLQSFAYVIFWLTVVHVVDRALLRPGFPSDDWLHWFYLIMILMVLVLHVGDFIRRVKLHRKKLKGPV